ncbi:MAG: hypothetical protein PUC50_00805 [Bacteroidales bacterium]|nr:hypothetical protein [Alphaproteobacteria bacterium]MDD6000709.1 hypothetical protein [Bacteroidales bacterium]
MSYLIKYGIIQKESKTSLLFEKLVSENYFLPQNKCLPHEYIKHCWQKYEKNGTKEKSINGAFFEHIIYTLLYRENILPFYTQVKVAFVPNIEFDTILYSKSSPICLSLKTSLRERYKQADLEAIALKYVHRKAQSYLLTLSSSEALLIKNKIEDGQVIGLDNVIDCNSDEIDDLIKKLKKKVFTESETVEVLQGNLITNK